MSVSESKIIDADGHVLEPANLWQEYIDPKFREKAPRLIELDNGAEQFWFCDEYSAGNGITKLGLAGAMGARDGEVDAVASLGQSYAEGHPGGFDPHARIPDMDKELLDAAFLYPTMGLFLDTVRDPDQANANARAYNRWLADYCSAYPERLFGVGCLPMQSVKGAIEEVEFCVEKLGFKGVFVRPNPYNGRALHHRDFDPVWEVAQEMGVAVGIHGGDSNASNLGDDRFPAAEVGNALHHMAVHSFEMMAAAASMVMGGVCQRFPRMRVAFLEAGGGWMPGWLDRMDRHFDDAGMDALGVSELTERPSEIFERQCFIGFEPTERTFAMAAELLGRNRILFATDYPHPDGFWGAAKMIKRLNLKPELEAEILGGGAREFYGLS